MIETKRLVIRKGEICDVKDVMEFRNTDFVLKYNCMNIVDEKQVFQEISNSLVLYEKSLKKVIGIISIENDYLRYGVKSQCLSYYMNECFCQKGYMSEALDKVVHVLFDLGCDIVSARVFVENEASTQLLKKLNFKHEGTLQYAVKGYDGMIHDDQLFSRRK